jgi:hypothetical protein
MCKYIYSVFTNIDMRWLQEIDMWLLVNSDAFLLKNTKP